MKTTLIATSLALLSLGAVAADYQIDNKGAHASINFKVKHLGYSWLTGRFNQFDGRFSFDDNALQDAKIHVKIDTTSIDSNHAKRDNHLRSEDFLNVKRFPEASFASTKITRNAEGGFRIDGELQLHGVTRPIVIQAHKIGEGKDPWGGYRLGLSGTTSISMKDFGIDHPLGDIGDKVRLDLHIEGIRQ